MRFTDSTKQAMAVLEKRQERMLDHLARQTVNEARGMLRSKTEDVIVGKPPRTQHGAAGLQGDIQILDERRGYRAVGNTVEYAPYLELGTSWMGPHPYLQPAVRNVAERAEEILRKLV